MNHKTHGAKRNQPHQKQENHSQERKSFAPAALAWVRYEEQKRRSKQDEEEKTHLTGGAFQPEPAGVQNEYRPDTAQTGVPRPLLSLTSVFVNDPMRQLQSTEKQLVMARNADGIVKHVDVLENRHHRRMCREAGKNVGFYSPPGKPFRPFEGKESFIQQRDEFLTMVDKAKNDLLGKHEEGTAARPLEIFAGKSVRGAVERYGSKVYVFNMSNCPAVREAEDAIDFQVTFELEAITGDPDLFVGADTVPTNMDYQWASAGIGEDCVTVLPSDPNFTMGMYYIVVHSSSGPSTFTVNVIPKKFVDAISGEIMAQARVNLFSKIKSFVDDANRRRRLCQLGTQRWTGLISPKLAGSQPASRSSSRTGSCIGTHRSHRSTLIPAGSSVVGLGRSGRASVEPTVLPQIPSALLSVDEAKAPAKSGKSRRRNDSHDSPGNNTTDTKEATQASAVPSTSAPPRRPPPPSPPRCSQAPAAARGSRLRGDAAVAGPAACQLPHPHCASVLSVPARDLI